MSAAEMLHACREHAAPARVVIAAAAVADYAPVQVSSQKLKKQGDDTFTLTLKPTEDILRHLAREKRDGQMLIGFAAETEALETHAQSKLEAKNLDMIVANDVTEEEPVSTWTRTSSP